MTQRQFEKIYQMYFDQVYRYLLKLCGDEHVAEELCSETFFRALKHIDGFRGDCHISSWLCQIAKNCYYSYLRRRKSEISQSRLSEADFDQTSVEARLEDKEAAAQIYGLLHDLKEPYKEVFLLRALGELSFRQIGEIFGKSENWACVTYHRARKHIREEVEK